GWLKARLGWILAGETSKNVYDTASGTYTWYMDRSTSPRITRPLGSGRGKAAKRASIHIYPQVYTDLPPGSICSVRLVSQVEDRQVTFSIEREDDPDYVVPSVELVGEPRLQRTLTLGTPYNEHQSPGHEFEILK